MKCSLIFVTALTAGCLITCVRADIPGRPAGVPASTLTLPGEDVDDASGAPSLPGPLTAVGDLTKLTVPNVAFYNFGVFGMPSTGMIRHDFRLRNTSTAALLVDRVAPGCDCTTASIGNRLPGPHFIAPQKDLIIHVVLDAKALYVGKINKIVWVYLNGQTEPAFTLHMVGRTVPIATFSPQMLTFESRHAGDTIIPKLTVTTEVSAYGLHPPPPYSLGAKLKVAPTAEKPILASGHLSRTYSVILPQTTPPGLFNDIIAMPLNNGTHDTGPSILVSGTVATRNSP